MDAVNDAYETFQELLRAREAVAAGAVIGAWDFPHLDELEELVDRARDAWVGAAVTEIASLRSEVSGPQWG